MNRIKNIVGMFAFSLMVLALPAAASAQYNGGYGYPNGGYGNQGGYGYNRDLRGTLDTLHNQAKDFERAADRGNSRYRNDNLKQLSKDFEDATKDLKNNYDGGRDLNKSSDEARRVMDLASQIDREVSNSGSYNNGGYGNRGGYGNQGGYGNNYGLEGQWNQMRLGIQAVYDTYGNGGYNNGGYNNQRNNRYPRNNRSGDWRSRVPFPLPF